MSSPTCDGMVSSSQTRHPKAAVFLHCNASHVFAINDLRTDAPAEDEVAHIFGRCPQCRPTSAYAHATAGRSCAFCNRRMAYKADGTQCCRTEACWFSRCSAENGTEQAVNMWAGMYENQGNVHFSGGERKNTVKANDIGALTDEDIEAAKILISMSSRSTGNGKWEGAL